MAQALSGVLYVEYFEPTENPGEYRFENGVYNIQNDPLLEGAYGINTNYVLFSPVNDINTAMPIPGVLQRYKFIEVTPVDSVRVSGKIVFDEDGAEVGVPGSGVFCLVSQVTPNRRLAVPPLDVMYADLISGGTIAAMLNDLVNILDKTSGGGSSGQSNPPAVLIVSNSGQVQFTLPYTPVNVESSVLIVNGVSYRYGPDNDFVVNGQTVFWLNDTFVLDQNDTVIFR